MVVKREGRSLTAILMAAAALIVSAIGFLSHREAGAAGATKVYGEKSDCTTSSCFYLAGNSVGTDEIEKNAVTSVELIKNAVQSQDVLNGTLDGKDIGQLDLANVDDVFPSVVAAANVSLGNASNHYFGASGATPALDWFHNYDTVSARGEGTWTSCATDPSEPPPFPCLRVPSTGTYLVSVRGLWEENTTGERQLSLIDTGPDCSVGSASTEGILLAKAPASDLAAVDSGGRLQAASAVVELTEGQCIIGHARNGDSGTELDLAFRVGIVMQ